MHMLKSTLFKILFPYRSLQSIELEFPVSYGRSFLVMFYIFYFTFKILLSSVLLQNSDKTKDITLCISLLVARMTFLSPSIIIFTLYYHRASTSLKTSSQRAQLRENTLYLFGNRRYSLLSSADNKACSPFQGYFFCHCYIH